MSLHPALCDALTTRFASRLAAAPRLHLDALVLTLDNGVALTIRYAADDAYSLCWTHDGRHFGIDTAPLHRGLATFPNHYHDGDGRLLADPHTDPANPPAENVSRLIEALLALPAGTDTCP